jgi:hypothetical protein
LIIRKATGIRTPGINEATKQQIKNSAFCPSRIPMWIRIPVQIANNMSNLDIIVKYALVEPIDGIEVFRINSTNLSVIGVGTGRAYFFEKILNFFF